MNWMNLSFKLQGFHIPEAEKRLKEIQQRCKQDLEAYHLEKKNLILQHHIKNNPAYAAFVGHNTEWSDLPILTKSSIQAPLEERLSQGFKATDVHLHNTSGSSGTPFYFAKDKPCHALSWALIRNRFAWHDIEIGRDLQARFYGIPLSSIKYYKEKLKDQIACRVRFPVFDLSDRVLEQYVEQFNRQAFVYINGYTSSLVLLARYCMKNHFTLKSICPTLKVTFTTSEVCDSIDREVLEKGLGTRVVNEYGAAELDLLGFEDAQGDFLLTHETQYIEILNDEGQAVKPGEEGRVIVTALYNHAMPFIRYELGDRVLLKSSKKGPYQVIERIVGRTNDIAILPSGKKSPGLTFYYISKSLLEGGGFMKEFIIRQKTLQHFHFEYVAEREISDLEKIKIKEAMDQYLEPGLEATYEKKTHIERTKAGKLKQFFSEL
jgi:phenylacetate-CoA ligase